MSALIAYRNLSDGVPLSGAELPKFPLSNLQQRELSSTWRAEVTSAPVILLDLGAVQVIRCVALIGANQEMRSGDSTMVETSIDGVNWSANWIQAPVDDAARNLQKIVVALQPQDGSHSPARYLRITPGWTPANEATYYEAARLWISDAIVFPDEVDGNWELGVRDRGRIDESGGLQVRADVRKKQRTLRMAITAVPTEVAFGFADDAIDAEDIPSLQDMMLHAGSTGEVLALIRNYGSPENAALWMRRLGIYGHLTDDSLFIRHDDGPHHSATLTIIEEC
jgi:hypothetical protein